MMRRVICFLLVLVLCMSMATTAFASVSSPGPEDRPDTPSGGNPPTGDIIMRWVIIMVLALLALCVMFVLYRKLFRK